MKKNIIAAGLFLTGALSISSLATAKMAWLPARATASWGGAAVNVYDGLVGGLPVFSLPAEDTGAVSTTWFRFYTSTGVTYADGYSRYADGTFYNYVSTTWATTPGYYYLSITRPPGGYVSYKLNLGSSQNIQSYGYDY